MIALGMLVDDAVVIVEAIYRRLHAAILRTRRWWPPWKSACR